MTGDYACALALVQACDARDVTAVRDLLAQTRMADLNAGLIELVRSLRASFAVAMDATVEDVNAALWAAS